MNYRIFNGEACNLGRFGWVEKGTPLVLSDKEAEMVKGDKRFVVNRNPEQSTKTNNPTINRENAPARVGVLDLQAKSKEELLALAETYAKEGRQFQLSKHPTKAELLRILKPFVEEPIPAQGEAEPSGPEGQGEQKSAE